MAALREILARFSFSFDSGGLRKVDTSLERTIGTVRQLAGFFGGGLLIREAKQFFDTIVEGGDRVDKHSQQIGVGRKAYQELANAAQFSGAKVEEMEVSVKTLGRNLQVLADTGKGEAAPALDALGIASKDLEGLTLDQKFLEIGAALGGVKDETQKVAFAQKIFGEGGTKLLPLFNLQKEGMQELIAKTEEFGGAYSDFAVDQSAAAADRMLELDIATNSLKSTLAVAFLPTINAGIGRLAKFAAWLSTNEEKSQLLKSVQVSLGVVAAGAAAKMAMSYGRLILQAGKALAIFALLVLIVQDLIVFWQGGESAVGRLLARLMEFAGVNDTVDEFRNRLHAADGVLGVLEETAATVGHALIAAFEEAASRLGAALIQAGVDAIAWWANLPQQLASEGKPWSAVGVAAGQFFLEGLGTSLLGGLPAILGSARDMASSFFSDSGGGSGSPGGLVGKARDLAGNGILSAYAPGPGASIGGPGLFSQLSGALANPTSIQGGPVQVNINTTVQGTGNVGADTSAALRKGADAVSRAGELLSAKALGG